MKRIGLGLVSGLLCFPAVAEEQAARPRITGIAHVRVLATNADRSRDFYSRILGLGSGGAGCGSNVSCFSVNDRQQIEVVPAGPRPTSNFIAEVGFETTDVGRMRRYLLAHKIAAGPISTDALGRKVSQLTDPEGHPLAFVQQPVRPKGFRAAAEQVSRRLLHAGFVVRDVAAADRFYRVLLGFRMYWHGGMKDTDTDWVELQVPEGSDWIEYMLNIASDADHDELGVMNHLALGVDTMKPAVARLRAHGLTSDAQPEIGRDGKWQFDIFDPDATRVEFMEFQPAQAPCCNPYQAPHPLP